MVLALVSHEQVYAYLVAPALRESTRKVVEWFKLVLVLYLNPFLTQEPCKKHIFFNEQTRL